MKYFKKMKTGGPGEAEMPAPRPMPASLPKPGSSLSTGEPSMTTGGTAMRKTAGGTMEAQPGKTTGLYSTARDERMKVKKMNAAAQARARLKKMGY